MSSNRHNSETPSLMQIIEDMMDDRLALVNVCMPAKVVDVDSSTGLLSVEPCFKRKYVDHDEPIALPIIEGVPLADPRAGDAIISLPIQKGDFVTLWFSQRSLAKWKNEGRTDITGDPRMHHLSDAIAYPGCYPLNKNLKTDRTALQIKYGGTKITMKKDEFIDVDCVKGKLKITKDGKASLGNGSVDLLTLVKEGLTEAKKISTEIQTMTFPTAMGPTGSVSLPTPFVNIVTALEKVLTKLDQILV